MKALLLEKQGTLKTVENRPIPEAVAPNSVLINIAACGICGSDIPRGFDGKAYHYPLVMGHEFSGVLAEDSECGEWKTGDRVAVFPLIECGKCKPCQTGDYAQCTDYNYFGSRCDGAFAEQLRVPVKNLFRVPDHVNLLHASMTEPCAVALHGVRKMNVQAGDVGLVIGAGPIGNMAAQWLRINGCQRVIISDIDERKLKIAEEMGFETINSKTQDPVQSVYDMTGGEGAQRVIEACGLPITFLQAVQACARFGEVVFMGNIMGTFQIGEKDFSDILRKELTIYGTWNSKIAPMGTDDWSTVLKYLDREFVVAPLITDKPSLDEGAEIFESVRSRKAFHNKVIFNILPNANQ